MSAAHRAPRCAVVPLVAAALLSTRAKAADPLEEVAHDITVDFAPRHATLVVRRTVQTAYLDDHEAHFVVRTNSGLVATGLRIRADSGRWYEAALRPLDDAIATYWTLTGSHKVAPERPVGQRFPQLTPKDPALMMWSPSGFDVYVFPVAQGHPRTVEYTLVAPYEYEGGAYTVAIPVGQVHELPPQIRIGALPPGFRATIGDKKVSTGSVVTATTEGELTARVAPPSQPPLTVRLAATPAGRRHLVRAEVEAGPELGPDPTNAHSVIVLDRSRSMTESGIDAARRAALGYLDRLAQVPGARAEIVSFDRAAAPLHGGFVSPAEAAASLRAASLTLANGSDLAGALRRANALLKTVPRGRPRRVLVLSDTAIAPTEEVEVRRLFGETGAIVHVADLEGGRYSRIEVNDTHRWYGAVAATGGLVWTGQVDALAAGPDPHFSEWVRPGAVRGLKMALDGEPLGELDLLAGEGTMEVDLRERAPRRVMATGWLWSRPIAVSGGRTGPVDREWTVLAAAHLDDRLTDDELRDVATRAGAVSPVTALLALEPAASPGQAAPPENAAPTQRSIACGFGGASGSLGRLSLEFDEPQFIRQAVEDAARACRVRHRDVEAELTTTYAEVVAVTRVDVDGAPEASACIRERLWALEFPPGRDVLSEHVVQLDGESR